MQFFFVGLAMRSRAHDYGPIHAALFEMRAHRVSVRIWLCAVAEEDCDAVFMHLGRALATEDEMLIVEVPQHLRSPVVATIAA